MNSAIVVSDSISPSAQSGKACKKGDTEATSFLDTYDQCVKDVEKEANISSEPVSLKEKAKSLLDGLTDLHEQMGSLKGFFSSFFTTNDIPKNPPVEFGYDKETDSITVTSDREDAESISQLINSDEQMKERVKSVLAQAKDVLSQSDMLIEGEAPEDERPISLMYGVNASIATDMRLAVDSEQIDAEQEESDELFAMFEEIKHLMLLMFIHKDPDEEEEQQAGKSDNGAVDEPADEDGESPSLEYLRLMQQIEQTREEALDKFGSDQNRNAFAVESATDKQRREESEAEDTDAGERTEVSDESAEMV